MRSSTARRLAILMLVVASAAACSRASESEANQPEPARVDPIAGSELSRVTLVDRAAQRLGIESTPVRRGPATAVANITVVPYSAVLYAADGQTWAYTVVAPLAYVRHRITVDHIDGDAAYLTDGPPPGTDVVTVGAQELLGTETGASGEG